MKRSREEEEGKEKGPKQPKEEKSPNQGGGGGGEVQAKALNPESLISEQWHKKVEGLWEGTPHHYEADGTYVGHSHPRRTIIRGSNFQGNSDPSRVFIQVPSDFFFNQGPYQGRIQCTDQSAWIRHTPKGRIYEGPDFFGVGYPFGTVTLGTVHFKPWRCDSQVFVHIYDGGKYQVYDNVQHCGEKLIGGLNGRYKFTSPNPSPEEKAENDAFLQKEVDAKHAIHRYSTRKSGSYKGKISIYKGDQTHLGDSNITFEVTPKTHFSNDLHLKVDGEHFPLDLHFSRTRHELEFFYEGPDVHGTGFALGRALYSKGFFILNQNAYHIKVREFQIDDGARLAVIYQINHENQLAYVLHGVLDWEVAEKDRDVADSR